MCGADDASTGIAEQQDAAIGSCDAQRQPARLRHQRVAARAIGPEGLVDDETIGRMREIGDEQMIGRNTQRLRHQREILHHGRRRVTRSAPAIEAGINTARGAPLPCEKAMRNAVLHEQIAFQRRRAHGVVFLRKPGRIGASSGAMASALKSRPMPGAAPTRSVARRATARSMSSACASVALRFRACAR